MRSSTRYSWGILTIAAMLASCAGNVLQDWNGDGVRLVGCGGDSNTVQLHRRGWCGYLRDELNRDDVRTRAAAWAFTRAVDTDRFVFGQPQSSAHLVDIMLRWLRRPDVAILAWGTNDVGKSEPATIAEALADQAGRLRQESIGVLVATVPFAFGDPDHNAAVERTNVAIRERFGPCVVDFTTTVPPTESFFDDRLHLNDAGQRAWAAEAARALLHSPASCRDDGHIPG